MAKKIGEKPINDEISILVLKRPGEAPFTQIVASKLSRIRKLRKYIAANHGGKKELYQKQLDTLLEQYQKELDSTD
jgi:hypothetical protein